MLDEYSSQLLPYQTKAIADGLNHITNMSVKQYCEQIEKEYGYAWDGVRKEINTMIRYELIR